MQCLAASQIATVSIFFLRILDLSDPLIHTDKFKALFVCFFVFLGFFFHSWDNSLQVLYYITAHGDRKEMCPEMLLGSYSQQNVIYLEW